MWYFKWNENKNQKYCVYTLGGLLLHFNGRCNTNWNTRMKGIIMYNAPNYHSNGNMRARTHELRNTLLWAAGNARKVNPAHCCNRCLLRILDVIYTHVMIGGWMRIAHLLPLLVLTINDLSLTWILSIFRLRKQQKHEGLELNDGPICLFGYKCNPL